MIGSITVGSSVGMGAKVAVGSGVSRDTDIAGAGLDAPERHAIAKVTPSSDQAHNQSPGFTRRLVFARD